MLKRPTSRRRSTSEGIHLNLVPILDTMVTLIGFLLFTTAFLSIVSIESPFPQANPKDLEEKLKEKPLQLTVSIRDEETEIWSPFERITPKKFPHTSPGQPDLKILHETLIEIKQKFPYESKVVLVPSGGINYDVLVAVMDKLRALETTDPPLFRKNLTTGVDESVKGLFPEVIFGNLLGGG